MDGGARGATRAQAGGARTHGTLKIGGVGREPCDGDVARGVRVHPELLPREMRVVAAEAQHPPPRLGREHALLAEHLRRHHWQIGDPRAVVAEQCEDELRELLLVIVVRRRLRVGAGA